MACSRRVLVIGDLFIDIQANGVGNLPSWDEDCIVNNIELLPGGCAANTARQLSESKNITVDLLSVIGKDTLSKVLLNLIKNEKCNFIVNDKQSKSANSCIILSGKHGRTFITNRINLKYLNNNLVSSILLMKKVNKYHHIHIGGYYNCFGLHSMEFINCLIDNGYKYKISLDLQMSQFKLNKAKRLIFMKLCCIVSVLFINYTELLELIGVKMSKLDAMNKLIQISCNKQLVIVMKMGSKGCLLRENNGNILYMYNSNIKNVNIIDTTGAGDAFAAGFLAQYVMSRKQLNTQEWKFCLLYATATALLCIQRKGACPKPINYEIIDKFCESLLNINLQNQHKL